MEVLMGMNWWAILVFVIVSFALGALWYGPLFGRPWMDALGLKKEDVTPAPTPYVVSAVAHLVMGCGMDSLVTSLEISTWSGGLCLGLLIGIAFIASSSISDGEFAKMSRRLLLIQSGYRVVLSAIGGVLFAVW